MIQEGLVVLDTNVISEPTKPNPNASVLRWLASQDRFSAVITTVSQAEMLAGIEMMPSGNRRDQLNSRVQTMLRVIYVNRILPFDEGAAYSYGKILAVRKAAGRPIPIADAMIAAITKSRRATLATRNIDDFADCGIRVVNPWAS
jgi:hypothetical protein